MPVRHKLPHFTLEPVTCYQAPDTGRHQHALQSVQLFRTPGLACEKPRYTLATGFCPGFDLALFSTEHRMRDRPGHRAQGTERDKWGTARNTGLLQGSRALSSFASESRRRCSFTVMFLIMPGRVDDT